MKYILAKSSLERIQIVRARARQMRCLLSVIQVEGQEAGMVIAARPDVWEAFCERLAREPLPEVEFVELSREEREAQGYNDILTLKRANPGQELWIVCPEEADIEYLYDSEIKAEACAREMVSTGPLYHGADIWHTAGEPYQRYLHAHYWYNGAGVRSHHYGRK